MIEVYRVTKKDLQYPKKSYVRIGTAAMAAAVNRDVKGINRERRRINHEIERSRAEGGPYQGLDRRQMIELTIERAVINQWDDVTPVFGERKKSALPVRLSPSSPSPKGGLFRPSPHRLKCLRKGKNPRLRPGVSFYLPYFLLFQPG